MRALLWRFAMHPPPRGESQSVLSRAHLLSSLRVALMESAAWCQKPLASALNRGLTLSAPDRSGAEKVAQRGGLTHFHLIRRSIVGFPGSDLRNALHLRCLSPPSLVRPGRKFGSCTSLQVFGPCACSRAVWCAEHLSHKGCHVKSM